MGMESLLCSSLGESADDRRGQMKYVNETDRVGHTAIKYNSSYSLQISMWMINNDPQSMK